MIIEVTGTSTRNKGAELMLIAIREHFAARPDVRLAVDQSFGSYADRARYELLQKVAVGRWGRSRLAMGVLPAEFRRAFGLVRDEDVDVLLDASGFAFGDQHPAARTVQFAERCEAAREAGRRVILLPQALGPFERPALRDGFRRVVDAADLVFARDDVSMAHVERAVGARAHVLQAPDFTTLVRPLCEGAVNDASERVCIVPNQRMVEKAPTPEAAEAYVPLLSACVRDVSELGLAPVLLLHGDDDAGLAEAVQRRVGQAVPVHREDDPVALKRYIGESHLVVGSRFHALVAALSQGVPAVGTSWSHKYEMLFAEYGCPEMLLPVGADAAVLRERLARAVGADRAGLERRLREHGAVLTAAVEDMWDRVDAVLGLDSVVDERDVEVI